MYNFIYNKDEGGNLDDAKLNLIEKLVFKRYWIYLLNFLLISACFVGPGDATPNINNCTLPELSLNIQNQEDLYVEINGYTGPASAGVYKISWDWDDGTYEDHHWFPNLHTYTSSELYTITVTSFGSCGNTTETIDVAVSGGSTTTTTSTSTSTSTSTTITIPASNASSMILLIINQDIYDQISDSILTFRQDLDNEGYETEVLLITENTTPVEIRGAIISYYNAVNLTGVILIGNIKSPYFVSHTGDYSNPNAIEAYLSLDAIDMYYMDVNGEWEESDKPLPLCSNRPPNVVSCVEYPSCITFEDEYVVSFDQGKEWDYSQIVNKGQYEIEILVSRIMAHNLDIPGKSEADILNDYFEWNHEYRTGQHDISDRVYILNSETGYNEQGMDYLGIFSDIIKQENVNENDYLNYLEDSSGSKLLYLTAHSTPTYHTLYDSILTTNELLNAEKNSVFYLLGSCSACRWDNYISYPQNPNYLCGLYIFGKTHTSGDYGLGVIGFAGVGGFNNLKYFTDYLNSTENATYGGAFKYWFNENLMINFGPQNYVFLGDPTIMPTYGINDTTTTTSSTSTSTSTSTITSTTSTSTSTSTTSTSTSTSIPTSTTTTSTSTTSTTTTTTILGGCNLAGDYPPCGEVSLSEVVDFINLWATTNVDLAEVIDLINAWAGG